MTTLAHWNFVNFLKIIALVLIFALVSCNGEPGDDAGGGASHDQNSNDNNEDDSDSEDEDDDTDPPNYLEINSGCYLYESDSENKFLLHLKDDATLELFGYLEGSCEETAPSVWTSDSEGTVVYRDPFDGLNYSIELSEFEQLDCDEALLDYDSDSCLSIFDTDCGFNNECGGATPNCSTETHQCVQCTQDPHCGGNFNDASCVSNTCEDNGVQIAFYTSSNYDGNLGGLSGADEICQAHADAARTELQDRVYKAVLSTNRRYARLRIPITKKLVGARGNTILNRGDTIYGMRYSGFNGLLSEVYNERGQSVRTSIIVDGVRVYPYGIPAYTGSDRVGESVQDRNCSDWESNQSGILANSSSIYSNYVLGNGNESIGCDARLRLLCVSE